MTHKHNLPKFSFFWTKYVIFIWKCGRFWWWKTAWLKTAHLRDHSLIHDFWEITWLISYFWPLYSNWCNFRFFKPIQRFRSFELMMIQNIVTEAVLIFKILIWKNYLLTIVFNLKYQMKIFEKLFELFFNFCPVYSHWCNRWRIWIAETWKCFDQTSNK